MPVSCPDGANALLTQRPALDGNCRGNVWVCCGEEGGSDWLQGKALEEMTSCGEEPPFVLQCSRQGIIQILAVAKGHG